MAPRHIRMIPAVVLALSLVACPGDDEPRRIASPPSSPSPSASIGSPSPTPSARSTPRIGRPRSPYALYDLVDLDELGNGRSLGIYGKELPGGRAVRTPLVAHHWSYAASDDGRWLAATSVTEKSSSLFIARSDDLASMRRVASTSEYISSVRFRGDGTIFYVVTPSSDPPAKTGKELFYSVRLDGGQRRLIATFDWACCYEVRQILAFNEERGELLWTNDIRDGAGGSRGLFATKVGGRTRSVMPRDRYFPFDATAMTSDGTRFYYVKDRTRLIERDVFSGTERTLYRADGTSERALEYLRVTPDGAYIAFQATQEPALDDNPTVPARTATYRIRPSDGSRRTVRLQTTGSEGHLTLSGISPDGRFVWFYWAGPHNRGRDIFRDVRTGSETIIAERKNRRRAHFIAWVSRAA